MKTLSLLFFLLLASQTYAQLIVAKKQCNRAIITYTEEFDCKNEGQYELVFWDDFEGNDVDFDKWELPGQGVARGYDFLQEKEWYMNKDILPAIDYSNNITVENGLLKITAKKEVPPIDGEYYDYSQNLAQNSFSQFDFSSGELDTRYKFDHGIFEIRCKVPYGQGLWPAFWRFSRNEWNEIDVFEFMSNDYVTSSKRWQTNYHHEFGPPDNLIKYDCPDDLYERDYSEDFHIYTVEWEPNKLRWYLDGILIREQERFYTTLGQMVNCSAIQPWHQFSMDKSFPVDPMNIIVNLAIQNNEYKPDLNSFSSATFEVDYIKYYKKVICQNTLNILSNEDLDLSNNIYNVIVANNINIGADVVLSANSQLTVIYSDNIVIDENTIIDENSNFVTEHNPNLCQKSGIIIQDNLGNENSTFLNNRMDLKKDNFDKLENDTRIVVYDLMGKKIIENSTMKEFLDLGLSKGIYILKYYDSEGKLLGQKKYLF